MSGSRPRSLFAQEMLISPAHRIRQASICLFRAIPGFWFPHAASVQLRRQFVLSNGARCDPVS